MNTADLVTITASITSAIATLALVRLTARYVKLTHALVEETRSSKFPNVYADIEFDSDSVKFILGNTGSSAAIDVKIKVVDSISWRQIDGYSTGLAELAVVKHGIGYLAPGRTLKFHAGYGSYDSNFFAEGNTVDIEIHFTTDTGTPVTRQFSIDLRSYLGVLLESFSSPEREVAAAIRDAQHDRLSSNSIERFVSRIATKECPTCGEDIPSIAKKCAKCHEFIPQ